ncbi:MAG: DUF4260 domain-containing protein [Parachlamydiales bacterium]|nr:DUF4260 domain-containing protein [Parachlamydiales bacterium]
MARPNNGSHRLTKLLRAEGLALFLASLYIYQGSWIIFALLFFAPDISMIGYAFGNRKGAFCYNLLHTEIGPIILALGSLIFGKSPDLAIIWFAHIQFDRMLGFGLKEASGFKNTHLTICRR